ncbi:hypothetical protein IE4803_PA00108 (plasmid) [Rhizobium etli bv. phaseoli str. IE4803]|nr:hypothetical protein IE4803_PA00108 [Rhizobium etli bv. phaseoli str. IE4803]
MSAPDAINQSLMMQASSSLVAKICAAIGEFSTGTASIEFKCKSGFDRTHHAHSWPCERPRFDRVVIHPTQDMVEWLKDPDWTLKSETRAKLFVALTSARHAVAVIHDLLKTRKIAGFTLYQ